MVTAFVQSKRNEIGGLGTTITAVFTANVVAGNLIAGYVGVSGTPTVTITDSLGNTYTTVDTLDAGGDRQVSFYAKNILGGANTVTVTFGTSQEFKNLVIHEISGADATAPLDGNAIQNQAAPGTGVDAISSGSFTPVNNGCYIFGAVRVNNIGITDNLSAGTNYTIRENFAGGATTTPHASEDRIQATAAATSVTFTQDNAQQTTTCGMAFKPAAGAGGAGMRTLLLMGVGR